jgi:hypothetical protein
MLAGSASTTLLRSQNSRIAACSSAERERVSTSRAAVRVTAASP